DDGQHGKQRAAHAGQRGEAPGVERLDQREEPEEHHQGRPDPCPHPPQDQPVDPGHAPLLRRTGRKTRSRTARTATAAISSTTDPAATPMMPGPETYEVTARSTKATPSTVSSIGTSARRRWPL